MMVTLPVSLLPTKGGRQVMTYFSKGEGGGLTDTAK